MEFTVTHRDGPARIGELTVADKKVITPNILFVHTPRFHAPAFADIHITNTNHKHKKPTLRVHRSLFLPSEPEDTAEPLVSQMMVFPKDLPKNMHIAAIKQNKNLGEPCYVLPGKPEIIDEAVKNTDALVFIVAYGQQLFSQQSQLVDFVVRLREKIGYPRVLYLPAVGTPSSLALLTYLGVDLFDATAAIVADRNQVLFFPRGMYHTWDLVELSCSCPICSGFDDQPSKMGFQQRLDHNYFMLFNGIKQVRNAIRQGRLRELVEIRVMGDPGVSAMLRILDLKQYSFLEERAPLTRKNTLLATGKQALYRPEIRRFQERLLQRYHKPKSTAVLLLLPCSAKKPYATSKSHTLFREQLRTVQNPWVVHELIITSPLAGEQGP